MDAGPASGACRFDRFTLDLARGALLGPNGAEIPLRPKSFALLRLLIENAGRVVDRDAIMEAVWPDVVVTDESITQCVRDVRKALGDEAQQLLRTVPKRGYLLVAEVVPAESTAPAPRAERRLAAILAADIVGYSRLIEQDEAGTLAAIKGLRETAIDPLLAEHKGRIVKLMGDGAIVEFASVVDAVACAVAIQKAVADRQAKTPPDRRIVFRIGINLGDVVVDGEDLLGDGVNVAARLEQLCEPGGVLVSGTAFDHLQGRLGLPLEFTGEQQVKNIARPVRAYRVRLDGETARVAPARSPALGRRALTTTAAAVALGLLLAAAAGWWLRPATVAAAPRPVVAVLPFATLAGTDPRLLELADGLAVGVMDQLSIARFWIVLGRGTSFVYRDRPNPARALSQEHGATFVVDGTLQQVAEQLQVSAELIDAATGQQLWSKRFGRSFSNLATVQDELGAHIGFDVYRDGVFPAVLDRASGRPLGDLEANDLSVLARQQLGSLTKEGNAKGLELADLALARDPRSSAALWVRCRLYREQVDHGYAPEAEAMARWGEAATTLVELDPNYAWGRVELAFWYSYSDRKDDRILAELYRVIELAPNNPWLLAQVAELLPWLGEPERASELLARAALFDPDVRFGYRQPQVDFFLHRFREAAERIGDFTELGRWDLLFATLSHAQLGDTAETARWRARFVESWPNFSWERSASESGDFSPAASAERALWAESLAKADLPWCATSEQLVQYSIKALPECKAERAKAASAAKTG